MGRINVTSLIFEGLSELQQYSLEGAGGLSSLISKPPALSTLMEKGCWAFRGNFVFERSPPAAPEKQQPLW